MLRQQLTLPARMGSVKLILGPGGMHPTYAIDLQRVRHIHAADGVGL